MNDGWMEGQMINERVVAHVFVAIVVAGGGVVVVAVDIVARQLVLKKKR